MNRIRRIPFIRCIRLTTPNCRSSIWVICIKLYSNIVFYLHRNTILWDVSSHQDVIRLNIANFFPNIFCVNNNNLISYRIYKTSPYNRFNIKSGFLICKNR